MNEKIIANNPKASYEYFLEEKIEAGISLAGTEVKSLRANKCSIKEAYIDINNGEAFVIGMNIPQYEKGNIFNRDSVRNRKLLLKKSEIIKLQKVKEQAGYTIIPVKVYFKGKYVKVEIAIAKGKKLYDKRESIKKRDNDRDMARYLK